MFNFITKKAYYLQYCTRELQRTVPPGMEISKQTRPKFGNEVEECMFPESMVGLNRNS